MWERFIYFKEFAYVIMEAGKFKIYKVGQYAEFKWIYFQHGIAKAD